MGLILLGTLEPSQLDTFFKQWPRRRYTDRTPVEESEVRALIQAAGRDGYCYLRGVMEDSIAGLSVPVRDRTKGRAIAAINVSTSLQRTSPEEALAKLLPELRAAAQSIEAALP
jgi:IclR family transcriptional regulator, pca regulon regulatory protein